MLNAYIQIKKELPMNTIKSERMAKEFLAKGQPFKRKVQITEQVFDAWPADVFKQLCPTREKDWIDGWDADLVYTDTGYVESDCIFTTPPSNIIGPGLWIFTRLKPNELVELVRIIDNNLVEHVRIDVKDNGDGTSIGTWTLKFTALNEQGNEMLEAMPDDDPLLKKVVYGLQHYLKTGELMGI